VLISLWFYLARFLQASILPGIKYIIDAEAGWKKDEGKR
jgi:hypothetical protein